MWRLHFAAGLFVAATAVVLGGPLPAASGSSTTELVPSVSVTSPKAAAPGVQVPVTLRLSHFVPDSAADAHNVMLALQVSSPVAGYTGVLALGSCHPACDADPASSQPTVVAQDGRWFNVSVPTVAVGSTLQFFLRASVSRASASAQATTVAPLYATATVWYESGDDVSGTVLTSTATMVPVVAAVDVVTSDLSVISSPCNAARVAGAFEFLVTAAKAVTQDPVPLPSNDVLVSSLDAILSLIVATATTLDPSTLDAQMAALDTAPLDTLTKAAATITQQATSLIADGLESKNDFGAAAAAAAFASGETCGNGNCHLSVESCASCSSDCGVCALAVSVSAGQNDKQVTLNGAFRTGLTAGATAATFMIKHNFASATRYSINALTEASTAFGKNPLFSGPSGSCFADFAFEIEAFPSNSITVLPSLVALVAVDIDLAHTVIANSTASLVYELRWYNATSEAWELPSGVSSSLTGDLLGVTGLSLPGAYAVFASAPSTDNVGALLGDQLADLEALGVGGNTSESAVTSAFFDQLDAVMDAASAFLAPGDPPLQLETAGLVMQAEKVTAADLAQKTSTFNGKACPSVNLPSSLQLPAGVETASVYFTLVKDDSGSENGSGDGDGDGCIAGNIISYSIKDATDSSKSPQKVDVSDVQGGINFTYATDPSIPYYQRVCRFWNKTKVQANCTATDGSCVGDWDTSGMVRIDELSMGNVTVCKSTHLSSFNLGIDFTISAPDISLSNFDISKSKYVYITFGALWLFVAMTALYSKMERDRYDKRQVMIAEGLIVDDEVVKTSLDVESAPRTGWRSFFLVRMLFHFRDGLTTQHAWISSVWPTGRKVYPKRFMKSIALSATIALAGGLDAVFAYTSTAVQADGGEKPNTLKINGTAVPLDGFYAFLISLPGLLTLSVTLGMYSAYIDVLRKVAPRRFRAMNVEVRQVMENKGIPVEALSQAVRKSHKKSHKQAKREQRKARKAAKKNKPNQIDDITLHEFRPVVLTEQPDEDELYNAYLAVGPTKAIKYAVDPTVLAPRPPTPENAAEPEDVLTVFNDALNVETVWLSDDDADHRRSHRHSHDYGNDDSSEDDEDYEPGTDSEDDDVRGECADTDFVASGFAKTPKTTRRKDKLPRQPSLDVESSGIDPQQERLLVQNEFCEEVEAIVDRMYLWKRISLTVAVVLNFAGLTLAFLWIGALDEEQQLRWLQSFATFEIIAAVVAAPTFILVGSFLTARKERQKLLDDLEREASGHDQDEEEEVHKVDKGAAAGDAFADFKEELHTTIAQELTGNLATMNFF
eukprot:m.169682 g.169682  ORF g.169682 m.169682 type:complete len:1292 (-) comp17810_c7_seq3:125-4000(-)